MTKNARTIHKLLTLIVLAPFLCSLNNVFAATINAVSATAGAVQSAINSASDGDTVIVPAGSATWTSKVTNTKGIDIRGAGIGSTVITRGSSFADQLFTNQSGDKLSKLSGFTFVDAGSGFNFGLVSVSGTKYRLHHCKFDNIKATGLLISDHAAGVVDHCTFVAAGNVTGIYVHAFDSGRPPAQRNWAQTVNFGSSAWAFIEDCTFDFTSVFNANAAVDAYDGAKFVFRYNTVLNVTMGGHGADSGYPYDSTYAVEVYNNTWTMTQSIAAIILNRGGAGLYHHNTVTGPVNGGIELSAYRAGTDNGTFGPRGLCNGSSPYDGNQDSSGYPCCEQPGFTGPATFVSDGQGNTTVRFGHTEVSAPIYAWSNTANGNSMSIGPWVGSNVIRAGRDYFNNTAKPGYTPYTYPHPLAASNAPSPPTNLHVQ